MQKRITVLSRRRTEKRFCEKKVQILLLLLGVLCALLAGLTAGRARQANTEISAEAVPVPIIMYHSVLKDPARSGPYVISPETLEADLAWLKNAGYTAVFPSELIRYVESGEALPEKPVVLSFDDGYYNNYLYAFPLMQEYGMKMVLAVIGIHTDRFSEVEENNAYYSHCTWEQIGEMLRSGRVELANHTYNLHTYDSNRHGCSKNSWEALAPYRSMLCEDLLKLQNRTREKTGETLQTFVYPFGSSCEATGEIVKELGFRCTFSCESGVNAVTREPECLWGMKRFLRPSGISSEEYFKKILQ